MERKVSIPPFKLAGQEGLWAVSQTKNVCKVSKAALAIRPLPTEENCKQLTFRITQIQALQTKKQMAFSNIIDDEREDEIKEVHRRLYKVTDGGKKDTAFWLLRQYNIICALRDFINL